MNMYCNTQTKKEIQAEWLELCDYIKTDILCYDDTLKFPTSLCLRLKGLACNVFIPNKNASKVQIYSYSFLLNVFKVLKNKLREIIGRTVIQDERHLINLIMKIVNDNFNDIVLKVKEKEKNKEEIANNLKNIDNLLVISNQMVYNKRDRIVSNKLWEE